MAANPGIANLRPGNKRGPAKVTRLLKEDILAAAEAAHPEGRVGYLKDQAVKNPTAFLSLLGRILPTEGPGPNGEHLVKVDSDAAFSQFAGQLAELAARAAGSPDSAG